MKKILAIALALSLMAIPAHAATTGNWDMGAASQSGANAAAHLWQEQNKPEQESPVEPEEYKLCLPVWLLELIGFWKWW